MARDPARSCRSSKGVRLRAMAKKLTGGGRQRRTALHLSSQGGGGEERSSILTAVWTPAVVEAARRHLTTGLYVNAYYLISNTAVNSLLGLVFWTTAARLYTTEAVGTASAILSAAALLAGLSSLGLELGLARFLPGAERMSGNMLDSTLTAVAFSSLVFSAGFLLGLPLWSPALTFVYEEHAFLVVFALLTLMTALGKVIDGAFVARRAAKFTLLRQGSLNVVKIPLLLLFLNVSRVPGIVISVVVATGFSLGFALVRFLPAVEGAYRPRLRLSRTIIGGILPYAVANHLADLLAQSPQVVLPLLTLNLLGPSDSAYFYVTWMIANLLFAIPRSVATSMVVEGAYKEEALGENVARALRVISLLLAPAVILTLIGGDELLLLFGRDYAMKGRELLPILAVSAFPVGVNHVYFAINRVRRRNWRNLIVSLLVAGAVLGSSSWLMARYGIVGTGIGWLVGEGALSVLVLISLCRRGRRASLIGI